jgi:hypothetical protein
MRVHGTRVAVVNLPGLLGEVVEAVVRAQPDMELVGTVGLRAERVTCESVEADAFVVGGAPGAADDLAHGLLTRHPRARVLAVVGDGREGWLYRLLPQRVDLGELSLAGLIGALRDEGAGI